MSTDTTNFGFTRPSVGDSGPGWATQLNSCIQEIDTLLNVALDSDGSLKAGAVDAAAVLADSVVTAAKLANGLGPLTYEIRMIYADSVDENKNPVCDGTTYTDWFLCDGGTYRTKATPNMADRMPIGVGTIAGTQGATGGASTKDLSHTHGDGTLGTSTASNHTHSFSGNTGTENPIDDTFSIWPAGGGAKMHRHSFSGNTGSGGSHSHTISGTTDSGGSATQDVMNPYIGVQWFMYIPA